MVEEQNVSSCTDYPSTGAFRVNSNRWRFIVDEINGTNPTQDIGTRICLVGRNLLRADYVGLALVMNHVYSAIAGSDPLATLLDETQFALGDGPTFEAQGSSEPVQGIDLKTSRLKVRWPAFTPIAQTHDIRSVFAFPMRIGSSSLGVLTAYRSQVSPLSVKEQTDGMILASVGAIELVRRQAGLSTTDLPDLFNAGAFDQSVLHLAAVIVADLLNIPIFSALVRIRAHAFSAQLPVNTIARMIISGELKLEN